MSNDKMAILVSNVDKDFKLPHERVSSVKTFFLNPLQKKIKTIELQHTLKDINLEIKKGEFFGIVGRNGSGKSTLLKMLAGIYQPTTGRIKTVGKLVPFIELGVGFNPELSGRENVYLNGALLNFSEAEIDSMYDDIVEFAELEKFMDQRLKNYSSGMQVRLAFSMAVRAKADILLIDEVLAVGDADFQRKCFEYFKSLKKDKKTVVFVSHDMSAVREYCDRVALIDQGRVKYIGAAEEVAKKYMQLFAIEKGEESKTELRSKRWGDKKAVYDNVKVDHIDEGATVLLSASVTAEFSIDDPTYGFKISNQTGKAILGTNSTIIQAKATPLKMGIKTTISWQFPNIFNEGKYFVELVLMYKSITEVADWWEDAATFSVVNEMRTPYIVNPPTFFSSKETE